MVSRHRIVIGASAGGVLALRQLVSGLPADLNAAVFITLHMFEREELYLADLLNSAGPLPARRARDGLSILKGHIYVAPPDHHLLIGTETMSLAHGPREGLQRPSINVMFRSAAASCGERVAGVVLTGLLDDGAAGLWEIMQHGGTSIVQDPEQAAHRSMPDSAIRGLNVQYILPIEDIAPLLTKLSMGEEREAQTTSVADGSESSQTASSKLQSCPECGGVMILEERGEIKEYVCHVGHRLGLQSMISDKTDVVERTMWSALAQSEELVTLLQEAQQDMEPERQNSLQGEIDARRTAMKILRGILQKNELDRLTD